jgi:hypothetical protein
MKKSRNPYGNTKRRKAALAWMATQGIDQPRGIAYMKMIKVDTLVNVTFGPMTEAKPVELKKLRLI